MKSIIDLIDRRFFNAPMPRALFNAYLLLFLLTALVTLLGITNAVNIESRFLGKLFWALIAEVVSGLTVLFGMWFLRNDSRSLNGIKNGEQLPRASDPTISGQTSSHEVELGVEGELTSEEWFKSLGHLLDNSTQAKVYLREFEHPDDFKENHREELLRIMRLFVRMMIEHSDGFRIIAYRPIDSTKKEPVEWITQEIARSLDSERTTEVVEKCLAIINSQPAPNSSTVYIIDNAFVLFNRLLENGQRRYYRLDLSYSVLPLFLDVGFTEYFKGTTE